MFVVETAKIEKKIRSLLRNSEWPVPIEEIQTSVQYLLPGPENPDTYSPFCNYSDGQRLFHPVGCIKGWFTVKVIDSANILAQYEDGKEKTLSQGLTDSAGISGELLEFYKGPRGIVCDILEKMEDVEKVGNLYAFKSLFEILPLHRFSNFDSLEKYIRLQRNRDPALQEQRKKQLNDICQSLGIQSLYYVVCEENFSSILDKGILCRNLAPYDHKSMAIEDIQKKRHSIIPSTEFRFNLHDYVPLFFTRKPPLLYHFQAYSEGIMKICISPDVLLEPGIVFFDMNACSDDASSFTDIQDLRCFDWKTINHARYWKSYDENRRIENLQIQAEADIPLRIPTSFFTMIVYPHNDELTDSIHSLYGLLKGIPVSIDPDFF
jgi:hypothetical protein